MTRAIASRRRLFAILAIGLFLFARGAIAAHACGEPVGRLPAAPMAQAGEAAAHHACAEAEDSVASSALCHAHCLHDVQASDPAKLVVAAPEVTPLVIAAPAVVPAPIARLLFERCLLAARAEPPPLARHCALLL